MDKKLEKLVKKVFSIAHENLELLFCEQVNTFKYDEVNKNWNPDGFTLFIKVSCLKGEPWDSNVVEKTLYEYLGVKSVITV